MADNLLYDFIAALPDGCNSGLAPLLLAKTQTAFSVNATYRGGFISTRPPFQIQTLDFAGDTSLQLLVQTGLFQGGGIYRPDFGASQVLAQISGHLIAFTPTGTNWLVTDISIPGDLNDASSSQVWMWQSEKWMIINNGLQLPIFYDGATSRRSYGASVLLGTATAFSIPDAVTVGIGGAVQFTLAAPYTGDFSIPVLFHGAFYQTVQNTPLANNSTLTVGFAGALTLPITSYIVVRQDIVGFMYFFNLSGFPAGQFTTAYLIVGSNNVTVGEQLLIGDKSFTVLQIISDTPAGQQVPNTTLPIANIRVLGLRLSKLTGSLSNNQYVYRSGATQPNSVLGRTLAASSSGTANSFGIALSTPYSGMAGQTVFSNDSSGNLRLFTIEQGATTPPSNILNLINLTDTSAAAYAGLADKSILSVPELPAGRMGAYINQRNIESLIDGISFMVGDIVGGAAGTQAYNYRDAVLKTTENDFQVGGGTFRIPSTGDQIRSITPTAVLDASFGQGQAQLGTDSGFYGINLPVDRATWAALTTPILPASLLGQGSLAQNSTIQSNSDIIFRSVEGFGSFKIARREFNNDLGGNTPISREVERAIKNDTINLLPYGSATTFDNRLLETCYPFTSNQGVYHKGLAVLNFDLVSSLRGKTPAIWEGLNTGLNCLQLLSGNFSGTGRSFALTFNPSAQTIELYEILKSTSTQYNDNGDTRIKMMFETSCLFGKDVKPINQLLKLTDGEIMLQDIRGTVDVKVEWRPDYYPCWTEWANFPVCADLTGENAKPGYQTRIGLGEPSGIPCENGNNRPLRIGHFHQLRFTITGHCKFMGVRLAGSIEPIVDFARPVCITPTSEDLPTPNT